MFTIKTIDNVAQAGRDVFDKDKYTLQNEAENPDSILVRSTPIHDIVFGSKLQAIVRVGAGFNTIPIERCTESGIAVFNCPGGNANAVKELTIASMIMAMRKGFLAMDWLKNLPVEETVYGKTVEKGKEKFRGPELMGKTLGILGLGAIGSRMAAACSALGMHVIGYDPYLSHAKQQELASAVKIVKNIDEIFEQSDVITVHVPLNDETKGFIGEKEILKMKDGVYLVNYARGPILDNDAVVAALKSGKIAAFATDFPTPEEMALPNVVYTPHLASGSPEAEQNCSVMAANQTIDYLENGNVTNSINLPNVQFARADGDRICIIHANKVGMLGRFTDIVAKSALNIENLVNKSKADIAYTILDFDEEVPAEVVAELQKVDGVIRVRQIH